MCVLDTIRSFKFQSINLGLKPSRSRPQMMQNICNSSKLGLCGTSSYNIECSACVSICSNVHAITSLSPGQPRPSGRAQSGLRRHESASEAHNFSGRPADVCSVQMGLISPESGTVKTRVTVDKDTHTESAPSVRESEC